MDRVRDLVAGGGVYVVLAQDRDRFAREPAYHYLLRREFEEHGTKIRALNDRGDDSPEGELTDGVLDQLAKYERAKFTERSRRGKLQKARQGKIIATMKPPYGYRYNEARDALVIHEPERRVVERIFRLAADGHGTKAIQTRLYREGVPSPTGKELWHRPVLKRMVLSDTYKPHTYEETLELVPERAVAYLQKEKSYVIRCPSCRGAMTSHTAKRGEKVYHYYRCHRSVDYRRNSCRQRMERAQKAEEAMWDFASRVLKDPARILVGMDALIERKRAELRGDPDREAREWLERLAEVDQERHGYLKLAATGRMSEEEFGEILADLEETRRTVKGELETIGGRREEIEQLERDRDAIKASWSATVPGNLDRLTPEGRNELYHKLRLEISPTEDGYEITGPFCTFEPLS